MNTLHQTSCPYSNGNCFVAERRTWGFITEISAGCQQAQVKGFNSKKVVLDYLFKICKKINVNIVIKNI